LPKSRLFAVTLAASLFTNAIVLILATRMLLRMGGPHAVWLKLAQADHAASWSIGRIAGASSLV
jgi:hypothetical protein